MHNWQVAQDVGIVLEVLWIYFGWFLRVPSLRGLVSFRKLFFDLFYSLGQITSS